MLIKDDKAEKLTIKIISFVSYLFLQTTIIPNWIDGDLSNLDTNAALLFPLLLS